MITFTDSEVLALTDIVAEHMRRPDHTEVYVDVANSVETTPGGLLARLLEAHAVPRPKLRLRFEQLGGHVHCRLFSAPGSKHGDLVFDEREWPTVSATLREVLEVLPESEAE